MQGLSKPEDSQTQFLRDWLLDETMGKGEIAGRQARTWNAKDLVVLKAKDDERAPFSAWVSGSILRFFDRHWGFEHKASSAQGLFMDFLLTRCRAGRNRWTQRQELFSTRKQP